MSILLLFMIKLRLGDIMTIDELKKLQATIIAKNKKCNLIGTTITLATIALSILLLIIFLIKLKEFLLIVIVPVIFLEVIIAIIIIDNVKYHINNQNIDDVLDTPSVDASEKVYDFANILTDEEEIELKNYKSNKEGKLY